jgi:hypothetical protein
MTDRPKWRHDEPTEDDLPIQVQGFPTRWVPQSWRMTNDSIAEAAANGWTPLPTEHEPPPQPVERYTVEPAHDVDITNIGCRWRVDDRSLGTVALCLLEHEAERMATALNLLDRQEREEADDPATDPLIVSILDLCRVWSDNADADSTVLLAGAVRNTIRNANTLRSREGEA